jgi:hypothetical protein
MVASHCSHCGRSFPHPPHGHRATAVYAHAGGIRALPARVGQPPDGPGGPSAGSRTGHIVARGSDIGRLAGGRRFAAKDVLRMRPWHPCPGMAVQGLVHPHAASVAPMACHLGNPPRLIRVPDVCPLFHLAVGCHQGEPTDDAGAQGRARSQVNVEPVCYTPIRG